MTAFSKLRIAMLITALSACTVGEVAGPDAGGGSGSGSGSGSGGGGGQSFTAMISPLVTRCVGCHGSNGTPPSLSSFADLQAKYKEKPGNTNVLVTKGDHQAITYFNAADMATVAAWIDSL